MKIKRDATGNLDQLKDRLVAQSYSKSHGVDYDEVYSPVVRYTTIRTLLVLANAKNWEVHQMDVKTAFLNGSIDAEFVMKQPEGFIDADHPDYTCKLNKSLYGLKQAAHCWNEMLDTFLKSEGYHRSEADNCVYIKTKKDVKGNVSFVILAVYVDDLLPISNDIDLMNSEKENLCKQFKMVDQSIANSVLRMLIKRN